MKLSKLSLAAIVALGALTTTASATPLEEAIKGVDLSGFVRLRIYGQSDEAADERYRVSAPFTFKMPVADNLTATVTVRGEGSDFDQAATGNVSFDLVKAFFTYATPEYTVIMGKQSVGTPWTSPAYGDTRGDGILALYTGVQGWTFAGGFMANTVNATAGAENIAVAAAIGSMGPVNAQLWYADIEHIGNSIFAQLDGKMEGFFAKGQLIFTNLESKALAAALGYNGTDDSGMSYGLQAGYAANGFSADVGYTKNDGDMGLHTLYADDTTQIKFGKQLYYEYTNAADTDVIFANLGYKTGAYGVGAGYGKADIANVDADEFYVAASYDYSKNFNANIYYSMMDTDLARNDNNEFRACFKYKF